MASKNPNAAVLAVKKDAAEERVKANDQRELAALQAGVRFDPTETLGLRIELIAEALLGPHRYIEYVNAWQDKREELLDQAEALIARRRLSLPDGESSFLTK